jgi:hypothetical protein
VITSSGLYIVAVNENNNPTYLRGGLYDVVVNRRRTEVCFRSVVSGAGTFERKVMLDIFEKQGRVVCTPVSREESIRIAESHGLNAEGVCQ